MATIEVGRNNVVGIKSCPICGKPDWCTATSDQEGHLFYVCMRVNTESVMGYDGNFYTYIGLSKRKGFPTYEEVNQRASRLGINYDKSKFDPEEAKKHVPQVSNDEVIKPLSDRVLNTIYSALLDMLVLEDWHKEYLLSEGWTMEMIKQSGVKSFPPNSREMEGKNYKNKKRWYLINALVERFGDLTGVPGLYLAEGKDGDYWNFAIGGGLIFPLYNILHEVYRLRIRLDGAIKSKYRNFASTGKRHGVSANNHIGCYFKDEYQDANWYIVDITEGEKKAYVIHKLLDCPAFSIPGVSSWSLFMEYVWFLKSHNTNIVLLDFDADKHTNDNVKRAENAFAEALKKEGFIVGSRNWNISHGKGIDDCLLAGHKTSYSVF